MKTILIVGLGNPGKEYAHTRHNVGFVFADYFWNEFRAEFSFGDWQFCKKIESETSFGKSSGKKIILAKPQTFMNLSGEAVSALKKYYKVKLEDIFVIQDEIDLSLGKYKFSVNSSSAGHKGVQNIIDILRTKNITRLRIGVDNRKNKNIPTEKYVLGKFTPTELKKFMNMLPEASEKIKSIVSNF